MTQGGAGVVKPPPHRMQGVRLPEDTCADSQDTNIVSKYILEF